MASRLEFIKWDLETLKKNALTLWMSPHHRGEVGRRKFRVSAREELDLTGRLRSVLKVAGEARAPQAMLRVNFYFEEEFYAGWLSGHKRGFWAKLQFKGIDDQSLNWERMELNSIMGDRWTFVRGDVSGWVHYIHAHEGVGTSLMVVNDGLYYLRRRLVDDAT